MSKQVIGSGLTFAVLAIFFQGIGYRSLAGLGLQEPAYIALAILLIAGILWVSEAIPLFVTSLIVLFLATVWLLPAMREHGIDANQQMFLSPFFSDVIVLFLGGFTLSAALHKKQLDEWIAVAVIQRVGNTLPRLLMGVMVVTAFLSMWLSNTATAAMMLAMVLPIAMRMGEADVRGKAMVLAVPFAANVGGLGTPIGSPPNAIAMQYMKDSGIAPSFAEWMLIGIPGVAGMLLFAWLLLLWNCRGSERRLPEIDHSVDLQMDLSFWVTLLVVVFTAVGWMTTAWHGFSSGTVALVPVIVFFGTGILGVTELHKMSWEVLLMMGGGLCLGTVIDGSGLADWLVTQLPIDGVSSYWITVLFAGVACIMSSVMSNTATANLLLPIIVGLSVGSPSAMMIGTAFGCSLAMPLPISTPPNAMAFSSGKIRVSDMAVPGVLLTALGIVLAMTTGYWWWGVTGVR